MISDKAPNVQQSGSFYAVGPFGTISNPIAVLTPPLHSLTHRGGSVIACLHRLTSGLPVNIQRK
jgi:hypothetical protein